MQKYIISEQVVSIGLLVGRKPWELNTFSQNLLDM